MADAVDVVANVEFGRDSQVLSGLVRRPLRLMLTDEKVEGVLAPKKHVVGDFDGSGDVGFSDFLAFVAQFGKTSSDSDFDATFDLDGDGAVGFTDFLTFVEFFGLTS